MPSRIKTPNRQKTAKSAKSSPEARRLIRAAVKRYKTEREAARRLGIPNQAQLNKMLRGVMRDTPAMRAALKRADARARRAWLLVPPVPTNGDAMDCATVRVLWLELRTLTRRFESVMKQCEENNQPTE